MQVTWGLLPRFILELPELRFFRGQTIWLEGTLDDLRERRNAVLGMARSVIGSDMTGELEATWPMIAVDTISPRLANAICQAYVRPPTRTFSEDEKTNDGFRQLYEELDIDNVLNDAYRSALFTNLVFNYWNGEEFQILTPEYFRLVEDQKGEPELWMPRREPDGIYFDVWNDTVHVVRAPNGSVTKTLENPYGRMPGVFLKLSKSNDTYGAGITEAADLNCASNLITLNAMRIALYQGFSIGVATDFGNAIKSGQRIAPGSFLTPNSFDPAAPPKLEFVSPNGKFQELQTFREGRIAAFQKNQDLPAFLVDETAVPPTGVALQVAERQLNMKRRAHHNPLKVCEAAMAEFVSLIAAERKRTLVADAFSAKFAEPEMFNTPGQSLGYDLMLSRSGLIAPSTIVKKYFDLEQDDATAAQTMAANKKFFSFLDPLPES